MASRDGIDRRTVLAGAGALGAAGAAGPVLAQASGAPRVGAAATPAADPRHVASADPRHVAAAERAVAEAAPAILRISREVWALAEPSLAEAQSSRVHLRALEAAGFATVSTATSGTPTAFVSEWRQGAGGPVIGFLPEYDALPGLGAAAEPRLAPAPSGLTAGHGCGHNLLGAGCTGGAVALKAMMTQAGVAGTVRVYGCAAEEAQGVKVYMARDGLFDDLDAALAWHPAPVAGAGALITAANSAVKVRFFGRTAHAGNTPWDGRSALKGAELFGVGVQFMREHVTPTTRLHYVYESAGVAPNVTPDFAQVWLTIRGADRAEVDALAAWARQVAEGAALMTQTRTEFQIYYGMHEIQPNLALSRALLGHMTARPPAWSEAEQAFARGCQREMGLAETGLATEVLPLLPETRVGGSSDLGDVSKLTPLGVFGWPTVGMGTSLHTWAVTACAGMEIGDRAALDAARILAGAGFALMTDGALRAAVRAEFDRRRGDTPFVSALPPEQRAPIGIPDFLRKTGADEVISPLAG